jgi:hypothetical protein
MIYDNANDRLVPTREAAIFQVKTDGGNEGIRQLIAEGLSESDLWEYVRMRSR